MADKPGVLERKSERQFEIVFADRAAVPDRKAVASIFQTEINRAGVFQGKHHAVSEPVIHPRRSAHPQVGVVERCTRLIGDPSPVFTHVIGIRRVAYADNPSVHVFVGDDLRTGLDARPSLKKIVYANDHLPGGE